MCGILCGMPSAAVLGIARTRPGTTPSPACSPNSSPTSISICMPTQMPSIGRPDPMIIQDRLDQIALRQSPHAVAERAHAGHHQPLGGRDVARGYRSSSTLAPQASKARQTLSRLPMP